MKEKTKKNLTKYLIMTQASIYFFIIVHSILWYVFDIHVLTKLCPFVFAEQVGRLELNFAAFFWVLVLASTLVYGRAFCAWGCMFGAFQDFVSRLMERLKIKPIQNNFGRNLMKFLLTLIFFGFLTSNKFYWPSFFWFTVIILFVGVVAWRIGEKKHTIKDILTLPKYVLLVQYFGGIIALWITLDTFRIGFW